MGGGGGGPSEGHEPHGTALPALYPGATRGARATPTRGVGEGAEAAGARAHTRAKGTRGGPEGRPDRARGTHRRHGMVCRRARRRDTWMERQATLTAGDAGEGGGAQERRGNRHGPQPHGPAASAAHTRPGPSTRQGSSGTQYHAPAPSLGSLRASPWGCHWRQASSTSPAAPATRATTHQGGGVVGKHLQPRLLSDALTGKWRNEEAGEGRGSEPREPGGVRQRAGGES